MRRLSRLTLVLATALAVPQATASLLISPEAIRTPSTTSSPAAYEIDRAIAALDSGDLSAAEAAFREAISLNPKAPGGYIGMAEVAAQRNQNAQVEIWLEKAVAVDPNGVETLRIWGRWQYLQRRFAEAQDTFKKAVAASPDSIDARLNLGEVQYRGLKDPKAAEATFRAALDKNPEHVGARLALGGVLAAQGRTNDAVAAFEQAARTAPSDPEPLLALARYQASRRQIDAALSTLDRLTTAIPGAGQAYLDRGDLLVLKNDLPKAMEAYRAATRAQPATAAAGYFRLATLHEGRQQWAEAELAYRAAIRADPVFYAAYNNLAFMLADRREQLDEALRLANRAVELAPELAHGLGTLGWVQRARGELDAAVKSLDRAVAAQPRNPTLHYHRGIVLSELRRKGEARASFKLALEIDPEFRQANDAKQRLERLAATR